MALGDRDAVRARPAAVAVGDDRDVARGGLELRSGRRRGALAGGSRPFPAGGHQTSRISFSFALSTLSRSLTRASLSFCSSTSPPCPSSAAAPPSDFSSPSALIVSR